MAEGQETPGRERLQTIAEDHGCNYTDVVALMQHVKDCEACAFSVSVVFLRQSEEGTRSLSSEMCPHFRDLQYSMPGADSPRRLTEDIDNLTLGYRRSEIDDQLINTPQTANVQPNPPVPIPTTYPASPIRPNRLQRSAYSRRNNIAFESPTTPSNAGQFVPSASTIGIQPSVPYGYAVPGVESNIAASESEESGHVQEDTQGQRDDDNPEAGEEEAVGQNIHFIDISERKLDKLYSSLNFPCPQGNDWRVLAELLGIEQHRIRDWHARQEAFKNPAKNTLDSWKTRQYATVGNLRQIFLNMNKGTWVHDLDEAVQQHIETVSSRT